MDTAVVKEDGRRRGKTGRKGGGGGRKEGRARGGKGSESGKIKAKSESEGRERGREKEGKLDGVEKRGLGRCFSIPSSPCLPSPLFSRCFFLFLPSNIQNTSISRGIFPSREKKKRRNTQTKVVGTNFQEKFLELNLAFDTILLERDFQSASMTI